MKKLRPLMKMLRPFLASVALMWCSVPAAAQNIDMTMKNATVKSAMEYLGQNYDYSFSIKTDEVDVSRIVTVDVRNAAIEQVLDQLFAGQAVRYTLSGRMISVSAAPRSTVQNQPITGRITDEKGEPLIGATVMEKGLMNGTSTDSDGRYRLILRGGGFRLPDRRILCRLP